MNRSLPRAAVSGAGRGRAGPVRERTTPNVLSESEKSDGWWIRRRRRRTLTRAGDPAAAQAADAHDHRRERRVRPACSRRSACPTRRSSPSTSRRRRRGTPITSAPARATTCCASFVDTNPYDRYRWEPQPPAGQGWAITNRTLSFGGQPLFPPGIDLEKRADRPARGSIFSSTTWQTRAPKGPARAAARNRNYLNQSGIVWFPGSAPLYQERPAGRRHRRQRRRRRAGRLRDRRCGRRLRTAPRTPCRPKLDYHGGGC